LGTSICPIDAVFCFRVYLVSDLYDLEASSKWHSSNRDDPRTGIAMTAKIQQSRSLFRVAQGLLIVGLVMASASMFAGRSFVLPIALAVGAVVLGLVCLHLFYRILLPRGQGSLLYISAGIEILSLSVISISLTSIYAVKSFRFSLVLDMLGIVLALIGGYFVCRFLLGKGPGTYPDTIAARRKLKSRA
jgi:hypothetical protein